MNAIESGLYEMLRFLDAHPDVKHIDGFEPAADLLSCTETKELSNETARILRAASKAAYGLSLELTYERLGIQGLRCVVLRALKLVEERAEVSAQLRTILDSRRVVN